MGHSDRKQILISLCCSVLLALVTIAPAWAQQELTTEFNLKYFGLKKGRLAFAHTDGKRKNIFVLDFSTLVIKPFVATKALEDYPRWSPNGQTLSFQSDATGDMEIYTVNGDGNNPKNLSKSPGADEEADWSDNGVHLVFVSERNGGRSLFVMKADGSSQVALGTPSSSAVSHVTPRWSPRGSEVIYLSNEFWPGWDVLLFDLESKASKLLTTGYKSFVRLAWHPSGGSFVLSSGNKEEIDLWEFEKGAEKLSRIVKRPGKEFDAEWTNDGQHLFFVSELQPGLGNFQIFVWEKVSDKIHQVTDSTGSIRHLSWTPLPTISAIESNLKQEQQASGQKN